MGSAEASPVNGNRATAGAEDPVGGGYPVGDGVDPFGLLEAAGDLVSPTAAARHLPWLAGELTKLALGQSDISYAQKDGRFTDTAWHENPFFRGLGQSYRLFEEWVGRMTEDVGGSWDHRARATYLANIITATLAPTNFLLTNPAALKRAFDTGGLSLLRGGANMLRDLASGGMPKMADRDSFPVGEKLACTPGAVVYREEIFELLQYTPVTPSVRSLPLLMVPPEINRYYVLDLAPGRSMVEYALEQGLEVFMIVWRNPREDLGHGKWGADDYVAAELRAAEIVKDITHSDTINWLGLCAGGITNALTLGVLAAQGDNSVGSATFVVTMLSNKSPNVVGMFGTPGSRHLLERAAANNEVMSGPALRTTFAWLRPNDLVFNYLVSGWLLGEEPRPFDVLAWNDDATAVSARFSADTSRLVMDGQLDQPGGAVVLGTPIDLAKVTCDSFHVAGLTDHITRWKACYATSQLLGGDKEMLLVKSGHIQSFVNPARTAKYGYWTAPPAGPDADRWLTGATMHDGSWWPQWAEWILARSGPEKKAPATLGSPAYPPLDLAPGRFARE
ncbi:MAG TPA: alpha/beta fold hydrolase [Streptosporangiaceae bacterium]|jgi:polyhydroxyalkanoate synthase